MSAESKSKVLAGVQSAAMKPPLRYAQTVDGGSVAYIDIGKGPALIEFFLASTVNLALDWNLPQVAAGWSAIAERVRVLRFEGRGLANSPPAPPDRRMFDYVLDDIHAVVQASGLTSFALRPTGASCAIAVEYALRFPESVSHLVLHDPIVRDLDWTSVEARGLSRRSLRQQAEIHGLDLIEYEARRWAGEFPSREAVAAMEGILRSNATPKGEACWEKVWDLHHELDVLPRAAQLGLPVLVTTDSPYFEGWARELATIIPGSVLVLDINRLSPSESAEGLARFLGSCDPPQTTAPSLARLSARECEVLALLAAGHSNAEIAANLVLSVATVTRHVANVFSKLGVHNRVQAAAAFFAVATEGPVSR